MKSVRATSDMENSWKKSLKLAIRSADELLQLLGLSDDIDLSQRAADDFPVFVTREMLSRMRPGDPQDPLLRQVLPLSDEMKPAPGYIPDPLGECEATKTGGLLQKYAGRVLLVTSGACAIHCRYCFRRHFPYEQVPRSLEAWSEAIDLISADDSIEEVLLSGGDPLMLVDELFFQLVGAISDIPHIQRLRIHTRMPVVVPSRVTESLVQALAANRLVTNVVVHVNHPAEIDCAVAEAMARMIDHGIPVYNQSVLLRGVNDSADTMTELCRRLINLRVTPYYLHRLDQVAGTAHFAVDDSVGHDIIASMRSRLPGYAIPTFIVESPGASSKLPVA